MSQTNEPSPQMPAIVVDGGERVDRQPAAMTLSHSDLKRTLKDLLVADEVSDSDVELIEKASAYDERTDNGDTADPEMCIECGDQVRFRYARPMDGWLCTLLFCMGNLSKANGAE